ncbi:MAG TPA: alanine--tRNA ligase, partial [Streptosporangiaceae bacterium]|nr:alanine--tRNA ligase [Streptosporangiaceae bacterium]
MESADIARRFLAYFADRGHTVVPSASLIADDPTLLLVNAGMQPFKPYFLGQATPPFSRATSCQKCVRTPDIEEVGRTTRHGTFFQMLGNFSFGDYFKDQAIPFAWELLTTPEADGGFGFPEDRLWATVYLDDDEAFGIWHEVVGLPESRIQRRGMADNYWSMGVPGPCGPCSEIYYDRGPDYGPEGGPIVDEDRYLEVWNLVFMQYLRGEGPGKEGWPILGDLPKRNIDTGMGLERMAAILQGVDNIYEVDTLWQVLDRAAELTEQKYGRDHRSDVALRVVADHVRTAVMLVADGVLPSNEARGYVLRRILRRSIYNLRLLSGSQRGGGADGRYLHELAGTALGAMADLYPELTAEAPRILGVIDAEEGTFLATLRTGSAIFDAAVGETRRRGAATLSGEQAFQLHDTYGFPIDLTLEMANEQGLAVDEDGFRRLMAEQRQRAKQDSLDKKTGNADISVLASLLAKSGPVTFTGYDFTSAETTVTGLLAGGVSVPAVGQGTEVEVVLERTPFYAEGGGQLADAGTIRVASAPGAPGGLIEVRDVQQPVPGLIVHRGVVTSGEVVVGAAAEAEIDIARRRAISRSHTATHMVHRAFRGALGESAAQAGSENSPGRLRFDFTAAGAVPPSMLRDVEDEVNQVLIDDLAVRAFITPIDEARSMGAIALFGEKYGDEVRVVEIDGYSRELCGGTHVRSTAEIGPFVVLVEQSVGSGARRIEAVTSGEAWSILEGRSRELADVQAELERVRKEARRPRAAESGPDIVWQDRQGRVLVAEVKGARGGALRDLSDQLRQREGADAVVVASAD